MISQTKFTKSNCASYSNPLHTMFHEAMYEIINSVATGDITRWQIQDTLPKWRELIDTEVDINREATSSVETKLLETIDQQRDKITNYIFEIIRVERLYCPDDKRAEAARRLSLITKEYFGLQREGYNEQTIHTTGLIIDFNKKDNLADINTLGLARHLQDLVSLNEKFKQLLASRSAQKAASKLPPAKMIRPHSDICYYSVCEYLSAAFIYAADDDERERINSIIRRMNQRTEEIKARYKQTVTKRKTASDKVE